MPDDERLSKLQDELDRPLAAEQTPEQLERERRRRIAMENEAQIGARAHMLTPGGAA